MLVWHAIYGWDRAFEKFYSHICDLVRFLSFFFKDFIRIKCSQETRVLSTSEMSLTQELHVLRAHNLHYSSLLQNLRQTLEFISESAHPTPESWIYNYSGDDDRGIQRQLREIRPKVATVQRECSNILKSVRRLEMAQEMHNHRLQNIIDMV